MRAAAVHGVLLIAALVAAYLTWTRDESATARSEGDIVVWRLSLGTIDSLVYARADSRLLLRWRGTGDSSYLWATLRSDSDTAGPQELPVGDAGDRLFEQLAPLRALRDLGVLDSAQKATYQLNAPERSLTVFTREGERRLALGGVVFGAGHRYALDPSADRALIISNDVIRPLEAGQPALRLRRLHSFDLGAVGSVTIRTERDERTMERRGGTIPETSTWTAVGSSEQADQTFANFMQRAERLTVSDFFPRLRLDTLQFVMRIEYFDRGREPIGFLDLARAPSASGETFDFFILTERTRIPGKIFRTLGESVMQDLSEIF